MRKMEVVVEENEDICVECFNLESESSEEGFSDRACCVQELGDSEDSEGKDTLVVDWSDTGVVSESEY